MSSRLKEGGRLIDRARPITFRFDGKVIRGFEGDTVASALLAQGQRVMGRSFKYHRPRSVVSSGSEEPNALVSIGQDGRFTPNLRATTEAASDGAIIRSQNAWPGLAFDIGEVNDLLARFLPAGFYYKTFLHPRPLWKHLFEPVIRRAAGLGAAPTQPDPDRYEQVHAFCDTLVVGGGVAGLQAALAATARGERVLLSEQAPVFGGRAPVDGTRIGDQTADAWVAYALETLRNSGNITILSNCQAIGIYDHGYVLMAETLGTDGPRERLWRVRAKQIITATGAIERPLAFSGNDRPGVMLASSVRDYLVNYGVAPGDRTVIVTNNDDAYRTALALVDAGLQVPAILDARAKSSGPLVQLARARGISVHEGRAVAYVIGRTGVKAVAVCMQSGEGAVLQEIACDCIAMSGGWSPVVHLWSHCGGKLNWDEALAQFVPDPERPPLGAEGQGFVEAIGAAAGDLRLVKFNEDYDLPVVNEDEQRLEPVWMMPQGAGPKLQSKAFLDFQNDVKVSDVQLAAREGFESVEHAKRYTTLGMATDQGKLSNINGLAILSDALASPIPSVGTTTFRPPWTPVTFGTLAGEAAGELFQPLRKTPIHDWHSSHGAHWEPVGQWRRPYCYLRAGETPEQAVLREVKNTRQAVGLLDASTLGKILVQGPDAGKFLDMIYTNTMSTLKPGRCRYGLICDENGFLIDDGVVACLGENRYLCHTTTGGADRIHAWMEDWLQCEWWDWQVHTINLTEQFSQIAVVGPKARDVLQHLGDIDLSSDALPFMGHIKGHLAGCPVRVFRISFSGELSFEIAVPAGQGQQLWNAIFQAGEPFGVMPYGTEALHVMRAEKGFIMIGDETDGTIIPQDLGLDWAISRKKADYLGKRGQARVYLSDPRRPKLVGLQSVDGSVLPDGAYILDEGINENGQQNVQGRVTSTYFSPTLDRGIALALLRDGPNRMGETVKVSALSRPPIDAVVVNSVFLDPDGERQNV